MSILGSLLSLSVMLVIALYAINNDSGHTGLDPYLTLFLFIPTGAFGLYYYRISRDLSLHHWPGLVAIFVALAGCAVLIYLDQTNTLVQYERWIRRGMP